MKLEDLGRVNKINELVRDIDYFDIGSGDCKIQKKTIYTVLKVFGPFVGNEHELKIPYKYLREGIRPSGRSGKRNKMIDKSTRKMLYLFYG